MEAWIEENEILKRDENGELFRRLDINIKEIVLSNDNIFYTDLYDDNKYWMNWEEEDKEEEISMWTKCKLFFKHSCCEWIMNCDKSMEMYLEEIKLKDYIEEKRLMALAMRVCLLKGTIIVRALYEQLNKGKEEPDGHPKKCKFKEKSIAYARKRESLKWISSLKK